MAEEPTHLGFIGTGLMGGPMANRLLEAGYAVCVWNRSREKILAALEKGAIEAADPAGVTATSDIVFMCLTDAKAVEEVIFGAGGVAKAARGDKLLVDFSSVAPDKTRGMAERLKSDTGMGWVDAPISGGVDGAVAGTLAIFAGGDEADIARARPIIDHLSQRLTRMGAVGAGQVTKLCNQVIVGCAVVTIAEAIRLAEKSGVDAMMLSAAMKGGFADSQPFRIFAPRFAERLTEPLLGHVYTLHKDIDTARELGGETAVPMPMTAAACELLRRLIDGGHADHDIGTIMTLFDTEGETP